MTSIGNSAFEYCRGLTSLTIGNSVTNIGDYAFYNCSGLTSLTIPNSVTSIGEYAFDGCSSLTSLTIGNSVTSIGKEAFDECSALTSVNIADIASWCNISFRGFGSNPLFYAHHLYLNGEEVKDLVIPNSVTSISDQAFYRCSNLTSITIGNGVTEIGTSSFSKCENLETIHIGSCVTNIGKEAFANCSELKDVYCYATKVPTTGSDVFKECYIDYETLHVPEKSIGKYKAMAPWNTFGQIVPITEEETGIETIKSDATHSTDVYTLEGKQLPSLKRGFNIIRHSDGTTKKVFVK